MDLLLLKVVLAYHDVIWLNAEFSGSESQGSEFESCKDW